MGHLVDFAKRRQELCMASLELSRSRLVTPYAEHLLSRFCDFQSRVPLPENHNVPLAGK
jgi:hypothetical protein